MKKYKEKLSEDHPDTLLAMNNLACTYSALGRNEDALGLYETLLKKRKKVGVINELVYKLVTVPFLGH